jgi:hypothetical protein
MSEKPQNKGGRPQHEPNEKMRQQVKILAGVGVAHSDIGKVVGLSEPTLRRHYRAELQTGAIEANSKVAAALYNMATSQTRPNVAAAIFWLKVRAGWAEAPYTPLLAPEPRAPKIGKKAEALADATTAQVGTTWEALLAPDPRRLPN